GHTARSIRSRGSAVGGEHDRVAVGEERAGVGRRALLVEVDLEVEVRTGGVAVVADLTDDLTGGDVLAGLDEDAVGVHVDVPAVERLAVDLVLDDDEHARAAVEALPRVDDDAVGDGVDVRAEGGGEVEAEVHGPAAVDRVDPVAV